MATKEMLLEMHETVRRHKEHIWYDHHDNDMPPQLTVRWRDMTPQGINMPRVINYFVLRAKTMPEDEAEQIVRPARIISGILAMLADGVYPPEINPPPTKETPIEFIGVAVEGFSRKTEFDFKVDPDNAQELIAALEGMGMHKPGDIQRDFETNPASTVCETVTTYATETGPLGLPVWGRVTSKLHKGDAGRIEWDQPEIITSEDEGTDDRYDVILAVINRYVRRENLT